nr:glycerophosphodiester phosphodiesterase gdpd6 [Quercus suber]
MYLCLVLGFHLESFCPGTPSRTHQPHVPPRFPHGHSLLQVRRSVSSRHGRGACGAQTLLVSASVIPTALHSFDAVDSRLHPFLQACRYHSYSSAACELGSCQTADGSTRYERYQGWRSSFLPGVLHLSHSFTIAMLLSHPLVAAVAAFSPSTNAAPAPWGGPGNWWWPRPQHGAGGGSAKSINVQLGPRPFYLVNNMDAGPLKDKLESCTEGPFETSGFSISHRGAPLMFPEHSRQGYIAAARMGAGIIECDVSFTSDRELVCRHSNCDLHYTTDILSRPELAAKCTSPFVPYDEATGTPASAMCCTSDITLSEFKVCDMEWSCLTPTDCM